MTVCRLAAPAIATATVLVACVGADQDGGEDGKPCAPEEDPCRHGTCIPQADSGFECECDEGWSGARCDKRGGCKQLTASHPLSVEYDGTELGSIAIYSCASGHLLEGAGTRVCQPEGWDGEKPACLPDPCDPDPCSNDGLCVVDEGGGYFCDCPDGFEGEHCGINIDDCDPSPCLNGGTCVDGVDSYVCSCPMGYGGSDCGRVVDGCGDDPCVHATSCTDTGPDTYRCVCQTGYEGINCDLLTDLCSPNPCLNGGVCAMEGPGRYGCRCYSGYTGPRCENSTATTACILTYRLVVGNGADDDGFTGSNIRIRDTFMNLGDTTVAVGPGTLVIRVPSDGQDRPAPGKAEVLYYHLLQRFTTTAGATVITDIDGASPETGRTDNTVAVATGRLALGSAARLEWQSCELPSGYDDTPDSYTPDIRGTGTGCLTPFRSVGNVNCSGALCTAGNLIEGDNPQDETWEQRLDPLLFTSDLSGFSMDFVQIPDRSPGRTYLSWGGTLDEVDCR